MMDIYGLETLVGELLRRPGTIQPDKARINVPVGRLTEQVERSRRRGEEVSDRETIALRELERLLREAA